MKKQSRLSERDLAQFTGTENWYRHGIDRTILFTDGTKYLADEAGAYWLLDIVAICQRYEKTVSSQPFQVWKLTVGEDRTASLVCTDGNDNIVYTQHIAFTDFPLDEITLYFANNVIHLPSEY